MLQRPLHIPEKFRNSALSFKWDNTTAIRLRDPNGARRVIWEPVNKIGFRAKAALGLACLEWALWRLENLVDTNDAFKRLEAAWVSILNPAYTHSLDYDYLEEFSPDSGKKAESVLQGVNIAIESVCFNFANGKTGMGSSVSNSTALAIHILPKDCGFNDWHQRVLGSLAVLCPEDLKPDRSIKKHDWSQEAAIPRSWFENPVSALGADEIKKRWKDFLEGLKSGGNPYLKEITDF